MNYHANKAKFPILVLLLSVISMMACSSKSSKKDQQTDNPNLTENKVSCVDRQKEALNEQGLNLSGNDISQFTALLERNETFWQELPYCTE